MPIINRNTFGAGKPTFYALAGIEYLDISDPAHTLYVQRSIPNGNTWTVKATGQFPYDGVQSVLGGTDISVDSTDPLNPVINFTGGSSPASVEATYTCGENISGGAAVALVAGALFNFDITNNAHYGLAIGISKQAGTTGNPIVVTLEGNNNQVGGLTPGLQYAKMPAGSISHLPPSSGILLTLGVGKDATNIIVALSKPYIKI